MASSGDQVRGQRGCSVCKDGYACGKRWPDVAQAGRVGVYEGSVVA